MQTPNRAWKIALTALGSSLVAISLFALTAWANQEWSLLQLSPSCAPMHYNAAAAFLVWGVGLLAIVLGWNRCAGWLAGFLIAGAGILLLENQAIIHLGTANWWIALDRSGYTFPNSGMYAPGALGIFLVGVALALMAQRANSSWRSLFIALLGGLILIRALTMLLGFEVGGSFAEPLGPPVLVILGFVLGSTAILIFAFQKGSSPIPFFLGPPLLVVLAGMAITFVLWQALNVQKNQRIQRMIQFETSHLSHLLKENNREQIARLGEISVQWDRVSMEQKQKDIDLFIGSRPSCIGVAKIDPDRSLQWMETHNNWLLPALSSELGIDDYLWPALERSEMVVARAPRSLWKGMRVLVVFVPHSPGIPNRGGVIAVLRVKEWLDTVLNINVAPGYALTVTDQEEEIFGRSSGEVRHKDFWEQVLAVQIPGLSWKLHVWPTQDIMQRESQSLPKLALIVGFLTTTLLALAVHWARTARWRSRALEKEVQDRHHAETALKQSELKYRTLIENLEQGVFLKDAAGKFLAANSSYCHSVGYRESELIGRTNAELFSESIARARTAEDEQVLIEGRKIEHEIEIDFDGRRQIVHRILTPVRDAMGQAGGVLGICWNVTEQRAMEARLRQAGKMDAIGQLAGGIAHDFNNLLTAIMGNLDLLLGESSVGSRQHDMALAAQTAAGRAASLTHRLLGFSRHHQLDWQPTDVNVIVSEVVTLLQRTIDPRIRLEVRKTANLWTIQADPSQINQVLMNLCLNARDAINGAGRITIETAKVDVGADTALTGHAEARVGSYVRLRVTDTGSGMPTAVLARIFEPFFTTKEIGKGTGLGLSMVFAIVKQHQGWIDCRSAVGEGTTFDIYLPRATAVARFIHPVPITPVPVQGGRETILIVDDEPMIRRLAAVVLGNKGYTVLEAEDGRQAVELYKRHWQHIGLVVLDLTMPHLSGPDAFRQMRAINPEIKALFASGYAAEQLSMEEQDRILGFLKKPYRPDELLVTVYDALNRNDCCGSSDSGQPHSSPTPDDAEIIGSCGQTTRCQGQHRGDHRPNSTV